MEETETENPQRRRRRRRRRRRNPAGDAPAGGRNEARSGGRNWKQKVNKILNYCFDTRI